MKVLVFVYHGKQSLLLYRVRLYMFLFLTTIGLSNATLSREQMLWSLHRHMAIRLAAACISVSRSLRTTSDTLGLLVLRFVLVARARFSGATADRARSRAIARDCRSRSRYAATISAFGIHIVTFALTAALFAIRANLRARSEERT
jgi:hypothetical protein